MIKHYIQNFLTIVLLLLNISIGYTYQQQGFTTYSNLSPEKIAFVCEQQCIIILGEKKKNDIIWIDNIKGDGQIIVGVLGQNNQIIPLAQTNIDNTTSLYKLVLKNPIQLGKIPEGAQLIIAFIGNIKSQGSYITLGTMNIGDKIRNGWEDFWENESLMPYSINLRYGIAINNTSIVTIGYRLFVLGSMYIIFSNRFVKKKEETLLYWGIIIVLTIGIRNLFTWIDRTDTGLNRYTLTEKKDQSFFDLGDYISFTEQIRKTLALDYSFGKKACKIKIYSQPWPFLAHRSTVYLKPCETTEDIKEADYIIYYHQSIYPEDSTKPQLLNFNGSLLLQNK